MVADGARPVCLANLGQGQCPAVDIFQLDVHWKVFSQIEHKTTFVSIFFIFDVFTYSKGDNWKDIFPEKPFF